MTTFRIEDFPPHMRAELRRRMASEGARPPARALDRGMTPARPAALPAPAELVKPAPSLHLVLVGAPRTKTPPDPSVVYA